MRVCLMVFAVLLVAGYAYATDPIQMRATEPVSPPAPAYEFYCQPLHMYIQTVNASTAFGSEVADDIPDEFTGMPIVDVVCYVGEWGGYWMDPAGVYVNFYTAECPPGTAPVSSVYLAWSSLEKTVIYDDPGYFTSYRVKGYLPAPVVIQSDMSIGFTVDNTWGEAPPYCGIGVTDDYVIFGDCEGYWDGTYWGYPGWTPFSYYFGYQWDVAYCLSTEAGGNPHLIFDTCYIDGLSTIYKFFAHAGNVPVNDMEICAFIDGAPANIVACSVPASWTCHFDVGTGCIYYQTADNPILPDQTYGLFDIWVDAPQCYAGLTIVWTFTYDGQVVAGPFTTYFDCGPSATQPTSWGAIKSLYK